MAKRRLWGGETNTGSIYDPGTGTWTATRTAGAPTARSQHAATWTESKMIVWGGYSGSAPLNTGGVCDDLALLPPPTDFYTETPCRVVDTRNAGGPTGGPILGVVLRW